MKKLFQVSGIFLIALIFSAQARAQVNIETMRDKKDHEGFASQATLRLQNMGGNSDAQSQSLGFLTDYYKNIYHAFLIVNYQRAESGGNNYKNKGLIHLRGARAFSPSIALEAFAQKNFNDFINLDDRRLFGAGLRFNAFPDLEDLETHIGIGLLHETEYYQNNLEGKKRLFRSTNYISLRVPINEKLIFTGTGYYQPDISNFEDFRIIGEGSLGYKINKTVVLSLDGNCRYDSQPLSGVKKFDWEYVGALSFLF